VLSDAISTEVRWRDTNGDRHSALMEDDMGATQDHGSESPPPKFEDVYPHYEFSELVRIAVLTAERLCRFLRDQRVWRTSAVGAQRGHDRRAAPRGAKPPAFPR
jgi:hypothetical protein